MSAETYVYSRISVTNFDGITSGYWPDISFSDDEISPTSPARPDEFDGNYANWEFAAPDKGYGFLRMKIFPISHSRSREMYDPWVLQLRIDLITLPLRRYLGC